MPVLESGMFKILRNERDIPNKRGTVPQLGENHHATPPGYRVMTRFIGKIGLEGLAARTLSVNGWNLEILDNPSLDELRNYVRFDRPKTTWPMTVRTLYPVNAVFKNKTDTYEILHEWEILVTPTFEYYIVVVILGVEFCMNLGGPETEGYRHWLEVHDYASPLYLTKSKLGSWAPVHRIK
jgi:hypothetical protein